MAGLRELRVYPDPEEALVVQSYLRARGIEALCPDMHHLTANPSLRVALGGVKLWTQSGDLKRAAVLLGEAESTKKEEQPEGARCCAFCGAATRRRAISYVWLLYALPFGVGLAPVLRKCAGCGEVARPVLLAVTVVLALSWLIYFWVTVWTPGPRPHP